MTNEQLVIRIKAGIDVADNMLALWEQNQGLIQNIAKRYKGYEDIEDLTQQAYIGLCDAVDGYNPDEGVLFMTYAAFWIRQSMQRYIGTCGHAVRLPYRLQHSLVKYKRLQASFYAEFGREPTSWECCRSLDMSRDELERVKQAALVDDMGSLDVPVGDGEDGSLYDLLPGQEGPESEVVDRLQQEQLAAAIWGAVDTLPGKQPAVIRMRYQEGLTLKETGQATGVTIEQARQTQNKALRALRWRKYGLEAFLDERIYSAALKGNGVERFNQTWTSSTERAALGLGDDIRWY